MADERVIEQTASTELYNDDWFLKDSVVEGTTKISAAKLKELLGADGTQALEEIANAIAEEYDSTHTYSLNSWVYHEGTLYRCIGNNVTGTWNATKWQAKTIKQFIADSENLITGRLLQMFGEYMPFSTLDPPSIEAISKGDIFIYQHTNKYKFYRAKADHPQGVTEFDIDDWDEFDTVADLIEDVTENAGQVQDVTVDGTSVVTDKVAEIEIPVKDVQVKTGSDYESVVDASGNAKIDLTSEIAYGEASGTIASFSDGADNKPLKSLEIAIEPQQDLHGYDSPWVGGAGKNLLQTTMTSKETGGITFTVNTDGTISLNGTASGSYVQVTIGNISLPAGSYVISDGGIGSENIELYVSGIAESSTKYGGSFILSEAITNKNIYFYVIGGTNVTGKVLKPMICRASETAPTVFEPYSNECPISGWSEANVSVVGKNLVESTLANTTINTVGEINVSGGSTTFDMHIAKIIKGETYTIQSDESQNVNQKFVGGFFYDMPQLGSISYNNARLANTPATFTAPIDGYVAFRTSHNYAFAQIEIGSTATTYEPYNGHTYTIALGDTYYGGYIDWVNNNLVVTHGGVVYDGSNDEGWIIDAASGHYRGYISIANIKSYAGAYTTISELYKCSMFANGTWNGVFSGNLVAGMTGQNWGFGLDELQITDITGLRNWLSTNQIQIVYELATPLTIQLTPTQVKSLLGSNNVWADTGDINDCIYQRDINTTINDIIARIEALENA